MNYYKNLSKEERKKVKEKYLDSEDKVIYKKANRIIIIALLGVIIAIGSLVFDYIFKNGLVSYIFDGSLLVFSIVCIIYMNNIKVKEINKYVLKDKKIKKNK